MDEYVEYLHGYVAKFELDSKAAGEWKGSELEGENRIQLRSKVLKIEKGDKGGHIVTYQTATG